MSYLQKRLIPVRTNVKMRILLPDFHTFLSLALLGKICLSFKKKIIRLSYRKFSYYYSYVESSWKRMRIFDTDRRVSPRMGTKRVCGRAFNE